jgi:hypothetical protein
VTRYDLTSIARDLVKYAGGYLRNPVRIAGVTCDVCATPLFNTPGRCTRCVDDAAVHGSRLADAVAPIIYASGGEQTGFVMRAYKAPNPQRGHLTLVQYLTWFGTLNHVDCAATLSNADVTHWATVPSHPPKPGEHPLHEIVAAAPPADFEASLIAVPGAMAARATAPGRYRTGDLPAGSHVILIDDTWATGGHSQSAAMTLRDAGAAHVSIMVVARWINRAYGNNDEFIRRRLTASYSPGICPWTGAGCP